MRVRRILEVEVMGLGEAIKAARKSCGKSVDAICQELDVSRTYWYDLEKEQIRGTLSIENLKKIESTLGVNLNVSFE
jgi:transcriptional regulator with XRE-family HTH domain